MWFQWQDQADYVNITWHSGSVLANLFVLWNFAGQLAGCVMILIRKKVPIAVGILSAVIVIQVSSEGDLSRLTIVYEYIYKYSVVNILQSKGKIYSPLYYSDDL